jgi:hypothetical protein
MQKMKINKIKGKIKGFLLTYDDTLNASKRLIRMSITPGMLCPFLFQLHSQTLHPSTPNCSQAFPKDLL